MLLLELRVQIQVSGVNHLFKMFHQTHHLLSQHSKGSQTVLLGHGYPCRQHNEARADQLSNAMRCTPTNSHPSSSIDRNVAKQHTVLS